MLAPILPTRVIRDQGEAIALGLFIPTKSTEASSVPQSGDNTL